MAAGSTDGTGRRPLQPVYLEKQNLGSRHSDNRDYGGGICCGNAAVSKRICDAPYLSASYSECSLCILCSIRLSGGEKKRWEIMRAFKKYVAPQIVDEVSKGGEFQISLGGERREIAAMFVDIRGFTSLSENLEPEEVVEILNEYLNLTTHAIFKNGGTLDKFIGDATMAVFNAPFDLDDYIYRAVCTARDIVAGAQDLEDRMEKRFHKKVNFGIGISCGPAVVGNVGCDFRMDYTAIGDTVNTASRLEGKAMAREILISEQVYEALKDRIRVTEKGMIPLKGKAKEICVYSVEEVL